LKKSKLKPCLGSLYLVYINSSLFVVFSGLNYEVIIVEDNSPDGTLQVAQKLCKVYGENKIKILARPGKMGLGSAYIDGLKKCSGDFVFLMDADMSHHPRHIPEFIR
jgi:dolichol-phosphate mannosyltransferase